MAESLSWYSLDLEKHSCTPLSTQSRFMPANSSSAKGSVSSMRETTSITIFASPCKEGSIYRVAHKQCPPPSSSKIRAFFAFPYIFWCRFQPMESFYPETGPMEVYLTQYYSKKCKEMQKMLLFCY